MRACEIDALFFCWSVKCILSTSRSFSKSWGTFWTIELLSNGLRRTLALGPVRPATAMAKSRAAANRKAPGESRMPRRLRGRCIVTSILRHCTLSRRMYLGRRRGTHPEFHCIRRNLSLLHLAVKHSCKIFGRLKISSFRPARVQP